MCTLRKQNLTEADKVVSKIEFADMMIHMDSSLFIHSRNFGKRTQGM
jgi:hypothetical protein